MFMKKGGYEVTEEFKPLTNDSMYENVEHTDEVVTMELRGLSKGIYQDFLFCGNNFFSEFSNQMAVDGVSLRVYEGEIFALLGNVYQNIKVTFQDTT